MPNLKDDCFQPAHQHCYCIEFHTGKQRRGFHSSHLIEYTFEANPDAKNDDAAGDQAMPTERLAIPGFKRCETRQLGTLPHSPEQSTAHP